MAASTSPQTQTIAEKLSGFSYGESDALQLLTDGEEDGEEDDDEAEQQRQPADLDSLSSSPGKKGLLSPDTENPCLRVEANAKGPNLLRCEVCGARFETRRGLSSHARSHLRQLGIGRSESSGAPIDLLYQISKERSLDSHLPSAPPQSPSAKEPPRVPPVTHDDGPLEEDMDYEEKPVLSLSSLTKAVRVRSSASSPSPAASPPPSTLTGSSSSSPSPVVKKAPISSLLPVSSPLRSLDHKPGGIKSLSSSLSAAAAAAAAAVSPSSAPSTTTTSSMSKPFWAPQETDAPLNLTLEVDPNKDIICQLCGAWFETRKGLSSHARAHLRHFGVEYSESKGSPIDLLNQLIHTDDFKHRASALQPAGASDVRSLTPGLSSHKRSVFNTTSSSSSPLLYKVTTVGGSGAVATSSSVSLLGPAPKRSKSSTMQVFRLSTGELMSMPHNEPTKEIGCEFCGEYFENRKGLSSHARSHLRQMGITEWSVNGSPIDTLREIITRRGLPCALPLRTLKTPPPSSPGPPRSPLSTSSSSPSSASLLGRLPFAFARPSSPQTPVRKMGSGSRSSSTGLVLKLKPEPVQLEVTMPGTVGGSGTYNAESLNCSWSSSDNVFPLNLAMAQEVEPTRDIRCEFCGEYFENRKGLSSHARSHLRQMGITEWSVNGSPIDTLREIMHKRGTTLSSSTSSSSSPAQGVKKESSPTWDGLGGLSSLASLGFQSPKFSRKSPLNLLHSGSRLHKHGLGAVGLSATPPPGKFFGVSALGKRPLSEDSCSLESTRSPPPPPQPKTFSPLPHDFSFKGKSSPDKHGGGHQDASCELCGFYFENRKALASHARAHLRQFGVTEWCVNGSPIETLSAWMRSRPHKVVEMHRSYMQGSHSTPKKKSSSPRSPPSDSDHAPSHRTTSAQWSALGLNQARPVGREVTLGSPKAADGESGSGPVALYSSRSSHGGPAPSHGRHGNHSAPPPHAQVARSELNVRLPRGFERRPLKHPSHPEGVERESGPAKPPRTGTIPALVPKPPSTPLVKLVGKFYTLKCRFCEVEFHGPLSVQEDWIRHLQQHILQLNYGKPSSAAAVDSAAQPEKTEKQPEPDAGSAATLSATAPTAPSTTQRTPSPPPVKNDPAPEPSSSPPPPPTPPTGSDATVTATPTAPASTQPPVSPSPVPVTVPSQAL